MTEELIGKLGYLGIALILILGGLGLPIPEEAPIILAAVLSRSGQMSWPPALASCLAGVLIGDLVVYFLGYFYGEKVLGFRLTRRLLTRGRESQIKGYFHRHGFKILVFGRFVPGFRTAAYLTAGILKLPPVKLLLTDLAAATLSTVFFFGAGYAFAHRIQQSIPRVQQWVTVLVAASVVIFLLIRYYRARKRSGLPVGPPVLDSDLDPLSIDDLAGAHSGQVASIDPGVNPGGTQLQDLEHVEDEGPAAAGPSRSGLRPALNAATKPARDAVAIEVPVGVDSSPAQPPLESPSR